MEKYSIGKSEFGALMDLAGREKGFVAHRLYGHHIIYDFPIDDLDNVAPFFEHLGSDVFTKMGLPILPGEVLEDAQLINACKSLNKNWNFVNGFDILSGTISIYSGCCDLKATFYEGMPVQDFEAVAKTFGVSAINLAIAMTSCNPFLLIGSLMSFTAGIRGLFNTGARLYFNQLNEKFTIEYKLNDFNLEKDLEKLSFDMEMENYLLEKDIEQYLLDNNLGKIIS